MFQVRTIRNYLDLNVADQTDDVACLRILVSKRTEVGHGKSASLAVPRDAVLRVPAIAIGAAQLVRGIKQRAHAAVTSSAHPDENAGLCEPLIVAHIARTCIVSSRFW